MHVTCFPYLYHVAQDSICTLHSSRARLPKLRITISHTLSTMWSCLIYPIGVTFTGCTLAW